MNSYYISIDGDKTDGPLPETEIRRRLMVGELSGETLICQEGWEKWEKARTLFKDIEKTTAGEPPVQPATAREIPIMVQPVAEPGGSGAVSGGWVCLIIAGILIVIPFPTACVYSPLLLVVFILGIVAACHGRISSGITLVIGSLIITPLAYLLAVVIFGTSLAGIGTVLSDQSSATNTVSVSTNK